MLQRSLSGKLLDGKPLSQNKRLPLYNKQYIELAKSRTDQYITLSPDQLYEPEIVHQHIYNQMLEDEAKEHTPHLHEVTSGAPSGEAAALHQDIAELRATIEELKAELQFAKTLTNRSHSSMYIEEPTEPAELPDDDKVVTLLHAAGVYDDRLCSMNEISRSYDCNTGS